MAEQQERILLAEYQEKLKMGSFIVPDPLRLKEGWLPEKGRNSNGILKWPSVYFSDIENYIREKRSPGLLHRLLNEYKEGKAYRYFTGGFVKEIFYNEPEPEKNYCILKTKVMASQKVNDKPYDVWAIIEKRTQKSPGGRVIGAYCTCTAGLYGSCNHVAGLLFRIESAVMSGITSTTCTDKLAQWVIPKRKQLQLKPCPASDMIFKKDHYSKRTAQKEKEENQKVVSKRKYTPLTEEQVNLVRNGDHCRHIVYKAIGEHAQSSVFAAFMKDVTASNDLVTAEKPKTMMELAAEFSSTDVNEFTKHLASYWNASRISSVYQMTTEQAMSEEWVAQRRGRMTASNFHRCYTKCNTLRVSQTADAKALISHLVNKSTGIDSEACKYGRNMEMHAKRIYCSIVKKKHQNMLFNDSGLLIMKGKPYIAASTDLDIECHCCGKGHVEIKCPYTIRNENPSEDNLKYLEIRNGKLRLKQNSNYYHQIQGQMGVSGCSYADFFIYTSTGYHLERIEFDKVFWESLMANLDWFWYSYLAKALISPQLL